MTPFTLFHVALSLIGIFTGFIVLFGMIGNKRLAGLNAIFLLTTALTSITGFFFPYHGMTPGIKLGIISLVVLAVAVPAWYVFYLGGAWRKIYVVFACIAQYLNVFVLIAQLFMKVPALHAMAPTGSEPAFKVTQLVVLVIFVILTIAAAKKFKA
jgi:hypothetical protein